MPPFLDTGLTHRRRVAAIVAAALLTGCYRHAASVSQPPPSQQARLPPFGIVVYRLTAQDRALGREEVSLSPAEGGVQLSVVTHQEGSVPMHHEVHITLADLEPRRVHIALRMLDEVATCEGQVEAGHFTAIRSAFGEEVSQSVGYGGGTVLEVGTPSASWWWVHLLGHRVSEPTSVRAIVLTPPSLLPGVELVELRPWQSGVERVGPGNELTRFGTVRNGWPATIRTWRPGWPVPLVRTQLSFSPWGDPSPPAAGSSSESRSISSS